MKFTNWKLAIRNILKHKSLALINVAGLAIGLASSLLLMMHVSHESGYDRNWEKADRMYRISYDRYQNGELSFKSAKTLRGMAAVLKEKIPGVEDATEIVSDVITVYNENNQIQDIRMFIADSTFFSVFDLDFIDRKGTNPLVGLYSSVISESAARTLFGTTDAVGKWFKVCQGWRFCVTGVFRDLPTNTHVPMDMLLSWSTYYHYFQNWDNETGTEVIKNPDAYRNRRTITSWSYGYNGCYAYLVAAHDADPRQIEKKINSIAPDYTTSITKNNGKTDFHLQPVTDIHLNSHLESEIKPNGDRSSVVTLILISVIILCIAWINFINLTLIRAVERSRSIGLLKMAGGTKKHLIGQFMTEALITNLTGITIAVILVIIFRGWFASITNMPVAPSISGKFLFLFLGIIVTGITVSGLYPAIYLSSFSLAELFRGKNTAGNGLPEVRKFLVILQYASSIFLIASVLTIYRQMNFMKNSDLGIHINQTLVSYSPPTMIGRPQRMSRLEAFKSAVKNLSGVESITTSSMIPGKEIIWKRQDIRKPDDPPGNLKSYAYSYIDYDFIPTFNAGLLAGRNFAHDENETAKNMILNEAAAKQLGFANPETAVNSFVLVGKDQYQVIGVLKNYHQESLQKEIRPIVYFFGYQWMFDIGYYSVRLNTANLDQTIGRIEKIWNETYPEDHFRYFFLDDAFNAQFD